MPNSGVQKILRIAGIVFVSSILLVAGPATAQVTTTFNGVLSGAEPTFDSPYCGDANTYNVVGPVTPTVSGNYDYVDLSIFITLDMQIDVYTGSFDPANPTANYFGGYDDFGTLGLTAGTHYYFVVSPLCAHRPDGAWEFSLTGPGDVEAALIAVEVPTLGPISVAVMAILLGILATALLWGRRH